ncbi:hypothetical protein AYI68_g8159 [Smittium mucronatum]|uniref:DNA polymerase delta subunit 3 n=1 Tax=Smittium mucronatum TaxID=133383 RepID=A0A1R0GLN5_9FUNG|nr:hypothetical protein AYI68_g8159 [Smittium mucronatum]
MKTIINNPFFFAEGKNIAKKQGGVAIPKIPTFDSKVKVEEPKKEKNEQPLKKDIKEVSAEVKPNIKDLEKGKASGAKKIEVSNGFFGKNPKKRNVDSVEQNLWGPEPVKKASKDIQTLGDRSNAPTFEINDDENDKKKEIIPEKVKPSPFKSIDDESSEELEIEPDDPMEIMDSPIDKNSQKQKSRNRRVIMDEDSSEEEALPETKAQKTTEILSEEEVTQVAETEKNLKKTNRKKRKVTKAKHFQNERGMLVTKMVDCWESYSESEDATELDKPASNIRENNNKPAKNVKSNQSNLMSFFGQKAKK